MRVVFILISVGWLWAQTVLAQSPVGLGINLSSPGFPVATNFGVFSFETGGMKSNNWAANAYFFTPTNTQLLTLFRNIGVKSIRMGGDSGDQYIPSDADIDSFFGFAGAADVKVVFGLDLESGTPSEDASEAQYIWGKYATNLICFAIGNEPNEYPASTGMTNFATYFAEWQPIAAAVLAAAPNAVLEGPDNDSANFSYAPDFCQAVQGNTNVLCLSYHYKPLRGSNNKNLQQIAADELQSNLDTSTYPNLYSSLAVPAMSAGLSYRLSEFNPYYVNSETNNLTGEDMPYSAALYTLDILHWWAANGCLGVHYHTGPGTGFLSAFYYDQNNHLQAFSACYGMAAFNAGGYGNVEPLTMTNTGGLNLTAYAVGSGTNLYVTIINREYSAGASNAIVTISPVGFVEGSVSAIFLVQSNSDVTATNGVTLGGASISGAGPWLGQWTSLGMLTHAQCTVAVPAASAAIVRIQAATLLPPAITQDLPPQVILAPGENYQYSIGAEAGLPVSYQWYQGAMPLPGQTNATYSLTAGSFGSSYFVVITNVTGSATSSVSVLTVIKPTTNSLAATIMQFNPAGYWPMHGVEAPVRGDIETNYGTLGLLGTAFYPDWAANSGAFVHRVSGALAGDSDTSTYFTYAGANNTGFITNSLYVPHTSSLSTLNPPFTVECWFNASNNGHADYYVWSQCGYEGLNAGNSGGGQGKVCGIQLYWGPSQMSVQTFDNSSSVTGFNVNDVFGTWEYVVVTCDAHTNINIFTNGVLSATKAETGLYSPDYWTPFEVGNGRGNSRAAQGDIDEVAIYTTNLQAGDIWAHYQAGVSSTPATPYFQLVTNGNPVIFLRMDAPVYSAPAAVTWPVLTNDGSAGGNGVFSPGTMPGIAAVPASSAAMLYLGLSGLPVPPLSGVGSFADAGYASAFNPTGSNASFTVTAMFRGNPCDNRIQSIAGHGTNSWQLSVTTNGCLVFNAGNGHTAAGGTGQAAGDISTTKIYNDGNWHQVIAVNQTNVIFIYVDGALDTNGTPAGIAPTNLIPGNTSDVMIGSDPGYTNNPVGVGRSFAGQVCDVAFFTNALTAEQVQAMYLSAVTPSPETLDLTKSGNTQWQLNWNYGTLQSAAHVTGPYDDLPNAFSPYTIPTTNSQQFYRVREN